jgi:hypothetical protein
MKRLQFGVSTLAASRRPMIDINELKSGYELDHRVAIEALGWTLRHDGIYVLDPHDDSIFGTMWGMSNDAPMSFEPSTNMFPAWMVIEQLRNKYEFTMWTNNQKEKENGCRIRRIGDEWDDDFLFYGSSMPLIICKAVLKAVRSQLNR